MISRASESLSTPDVTSSFYIDTPTTDPADVQRIVNLYRNEAASTYKDLAPDDAEAACCIDTYFVCVADEFSDDLRYPNLMPYWVVRRTEDKQLVGMAGYNVDDELIHSVYLADAYRGRGLGSMLLKHMLREIPDPQPTLMVATGNVDSVRFYEKLGFTFTGKTRAWHVSKRNTLPEAEMRAPLRA